MKKTKMTFTLNAGGVDTASSAIQSWLKEAGAEDSDILRTRLITEELLTDIDQHHNDPLEVNITLQKITGSFYIGMRYGGERFNPVEQSEEEIPEMTLLLLEHTGLTPRWRWRNRENELVLRIPGRHLQAEQLMLICIVLALLIGLAGSWIPIGIRTSIVDYGLSFLSTGFLNLLNTFIGLMVFLSVVTGICGIGGASALGKIGKTMIGRYTGITFLLCAFYTIITSFCFPLSSGGGNSGSQFHSLLEMIFAILPTNPIKPFLEGNTLQIVFLAIMVGAVLALSGSETEHLRRLINEIHKVIMRCVRLVCVFLPIYIFSSLVSQLWSNGPELFIRFGKPLLLCIVLCVISMGLYLIYASFKLKVKLSVLLLKIMPSVLIAFSTASSSAALPTILEINEKKLGIDSSFSKMATPIGSILFAATCSTVFVVNGAFLASYFGIQVNCVWWIILWIASSLLSMAVPPVAGGIIPCFTVLLSQLGIPQEGLVLAVTLGMLMDFFSTASRICLLHLEIAVQADQQKLLDHAMLSEK